MRILILSPWLPHAGIRHAGGQYLFHTVVSLVERGHKVQFIGYGRGEPQSVVAALEQLCTTVTIITPAYTRAEKVAQVLSGGWRWPWTWGRRTHLAVQAQVRRLCSTGATDVVHFAWTEMGRYLDAVPETVATILATQDVEQQVRPREVAWLRPGVERWRARRRARRLARVEPRYVRQADAVLAVSAADAAALARLRGDGGVHVIPPWLDMATLRAITPESVVPGRLTFMGALDRVANRAVAHFLLDEVWPQMRAARAETTLWLVGANPSERLRHRAHDDPRLEVTGWVPDLAAVWAATDVALAPSIVGGGCLLKIVQPMAAGRPVVTTPLGAPQEKAVVANGPDAFAASVTALLDDRERWQRRATAGRRYVLKEMDWERSMDKLEVVYATALESRRRARCR